MQKKQVIMTACKPGNQTANIFSNLWDRSTSRISNCKKLGHQKLDSRQLRYLHFIILCLL